MKLVVPKFSQKDNRWANKLLGTSTNKTIGGYGCLLCSVCSVLNYYGKNITPDVLNDQLKRVNGFYQGALLVWGKVSELYPDVQFDWQVFNEGECADKPAPLDLIDRLLNEKIPVIVKVDFSPGGSVQEHWILIVGKDEAGSYICNDPIDGSEIFFQARYGDPVRYIFAIRCYRGKIPEEKYELLKGGVKIDEFDFNPKDKISDLENKVSSLSEDLAKSRLEVNSIREALETQERDNKDLVNQITQARAERDKAVVLAEERLKLLERVSKMIGMSSFDENGLFTALQGFLDLKKLLDGAKEDLKTCENQKENLKEQIKTLEKQKVEDFEWWQLIVKGLVKLFGRKNG